jgi:hypothetical protein
MHFVAIVVAFVLGTVASQGPEFAQQYEQRIGGAIDEVSRIVQHFDEDSRRSGYDRAGALSVMSNNAERLVRDQAVRWTEIITRLESLRKQQLALQSSGTVGRVFLLATDRDAPLASRTYADFRSAFSLEGLLFGGVVGVLAYLLTLIIMKFLALFWQRTSAVTA